MHILFELASAHAFIYLIQILGLNACPFRANLQFMQLLVYWKEQNLPQLKPIFFNFLVRIVIYHHQKLFYFFNFLLYQYVCHLTFLQLPSVLDDTSNLLKTPYGSFWLPIAPYGPYCSLVIPMAINVSYDFFMVNYGN